VLGALGSERLIDGHLGGVVVVDEAAVVHVVAFGAAKLQHVRVLGRPDERAVFDAAQLRLVSRLRISEGLAAAHR